MDESRIADPSSALRRSDRSLPTRLSRAVSVVLHPLVMPLYVILLLVAGPTQLSYFPASVKFYLLWVTVLYTAVIPLLSVGLLRSVGRISSLAIDDRRERILPLAIGIVCYLLCAATVARIPSAMIVRKFMLAGACCELFCLAVTFYWKISLHLAAQGAAAALLVLLTFGNAGNLTGALAVAVGAAVAAGRCCKPQAGALRGHCTPSGVVALAAAVCYGEAAVLRILWMGSSVAMLIRAALEALCAFWMIGLGLSWLRKDWKTPTRSLTPAVLGSAVFYWCVLARFMENSSSWHRVAPTAMVWQLLAGLVFLSALARALYLPGTSDGRTLCAGALASFALCLCWEMPSVVQILAENGSAALLTPELLFQLGLCCVGVLGGLCAVRCCRAGQGA